MAAPVRARGLELDQEDVAAAERRSREEDRVRHVVGSLEPGGDRPHVGSRGPAVDPEPVDARRQNPEDARSVSGEALLRAVRAPVAGEQGRGGKAEVFVPEEPVALEVHDPNSPSVATLDRVREPSFDAQRRRPEVGLPGCEVRGGGAVRPAGETAGRWRGRRKHVGRVDLGSCVEGDGEAACLFTGRRQNADPGVEVRGSSGRPASRVAAKPVEPRRIEPEEGSYSILRARPHGIGERTCRDTVRRSKDAVLQTHAQRLAKLDADHGRSWDRLIGVLRANDGDRRPDQGRPRHASNAESRAQGGWAGQNHRLHGERVAAVPPHGRIIRRNR